MLSLLVLVFTKIDKSTLECLEILIEKMADIQFSLTDEYRSDKIFRDKLLKTVKDVDEGRLAYQKPADTVKGVISDLHASLATCKRTETCSSNKNSGLNINYVGRKYVSRHLNDRSDYRKSQNKK